MASGQFAVVYRQIGRLFQSGSVAGLSEGQLLDRFVSRRDDAAFEAIVARHGPMVLGVCRGILRDPNDVDDAFQATFLVLVKKAGDLRQRDLLGNWLYGVAYRVAKRARSDSFRRFKTETIDVEPADPSDVNTDDLDVRPLIHDEVNRLPESYRAAVVLCFLQGQTHEEAARQLGWPVGTVKGRLARAKDLLRSRLTRRGLAVPTTALLAVLAKDGHAAITTTLVHTTTLAATSIATATALSAVAISPRVVALIGGVLQTMSTTKLKLTATVIVAGLLSASGVSAFQKPTPSNATKPATTPNNAAPSAATESTTPAEARLKLAEEALASISIEKLAGRSISQMDERVWQKRLQTARAEVDAVRRKAEGDDFEVNNAARNLEKARGIEEHLKQLRKKGEVSEFPLLDATFQRMEAEEGLAFMKQRRSANKLEMTIVGTGPMGEAYLGKKREELPADVDRNKRIEAALEKVVTMSFPQETPLEDVLKYIKESTKDEKGWTIPIYLNPTGLQEAEKTPTSTITMDLDDLPLRTTLRLALQQLSLGYRVRNGLLRIDAQGTIDQEEGWQPQGGSAGGQNVTAGGGGLQ